MSDVAAELRGLAERAGREGRWFDDEDLASMMTIPETALVAHLSPDVALRLAEVLEAAGGLLANWDRWGPDVPFAQPGSVEGKFRIALDRLAEEWRA